MEAEKSQPGKELLVNSSLSLGREMPTRTVDGQVDQASTCGLYILKRKGATTSPDLTCWHLPCWRLLPTTSIGSSRAYPTQLGNGGCAGKLLNSCRLDCHSGHFLPHHRRIFPSLIYTMHLSPVGTQLDFIFFPYDHFILTVTWWGRLGWEYVTMAQGHPANFYSRTRFECESLRS